MDLSSFEQWLGKLLCANELEVKRLLMDKSALHFLIAWSLFESKCFDGFLKHDQIEQFSERISKSESLGHEWLAEIAQYFHARYQDKKLLRKLMPNKAANNERNFSKMDMLLNKQFESLTPADIVYFVVMIIYRYRNNIFHGNKGVGSWLKFKAQIHLCTQAMQVFVSHAESVKPTMSTLLAA